MNNKMKVKLDIIKVGPVLAEKLLSSQVHEQRSLRNTAVKTLADEMKAGNFRLSADCLVLINGKLANGQHRLWAVIESNTTQSFLMMETDDDELYKVLDCGLKRTVGDAAGVSNALSVTAAANLVMGYELNLITQFSYRKKMSRVDSIEFIQKNNDDLQDAFIFVKRLQHKTHNICPSSAPVALVVMSKKMWGDAAKAFLEKLYYGNDSQSTAFDLRERFIKMRQQKSNFPAQYYLALLIKCFNSYNQGTKLGTIRMGDEEEFPKIRKPQK